MGPIYGREKGQLEFDCQGYTIKGNHPQGAVEFVLKRKMGNGGRISPTGPSSGAVDEAFQLSIL